MSVLDVVGRCQDRFGICVIVPLLHESRSPVFLVTRANTEMVLKVGASETSVIREVRALEAFSGHGAIRVVDYDESLPALLLDRAVPGHPLSVITDDDRATGIFCSVLERLKASPATDAHESIQEHVSAIGRYRRTWESAPGPLPAPWVDRAVDYLDGLIASTDCASLLHGDLHHANILRHREEWVVIDPKGVVGDPHFDVVQYLLNHPRRGGDAETVLMRRMAMITERLGLDPERIARWGVVKGILDACWALEDGTDWHGGLDSAQRFERRIARA